MSNVEPVFPREVVSQADAEAGTAEYTRLWSPLRVSQAIAALASGGASLVASDVAPVSVSNSTSATETMALTIAAADIPDGGAVRIVATTTVTSINSTPDCTFLLKAEGSTIAGQTFFGFSDSAPAFYSFSVLLVRDGTTLHVAENSAAFASTTATLSGDLDISITITWSAAHASNVATGIAAAAYAYAAPA